jgi:hypothetical protein
MFSRKETAPRPLSDRHGIRWKPERNKKHVLRAVPVDFGELTCHEAEEEHETEADWSEWSDPIARWTLDGNQLKCFAHNPLRDNL